MEKNVDNETKPLQTGRQIFSWFCSDAIDEPLNEHQVSPRQMFRLLLVLTFMIMTVAVNLPLFANHIAMNDINELFFGICQLDITFYIASGMIITFTWGSEFTSLFRDLEHIHSACKGLLLSHLYFTLLKLELAGEKIP